MSRLIMLILNLLVRDVWDLDLYNDPILVSPKFISRLFNYSTDDKSNNNDTPPSDPSDKSSTSSQDTEPIKDQKEEQHQTSETDKSTTDADTTSNGDSQPNS